MGIETVILWLILAALVGALASSRGNSFWFAFIWAVLLSPLIGLLIVLLSGKSDTALRAEIEREERLRAAVRAEIERERTGQGPDPDAPLPPRGKAREEALRARLMAQPPRPNRSVDKDPYG